MPSQLISAAIRLAARGINLWARTLETQRDPPPALVPVNTIVNINFSVFSIYIQK